MGNIKSAKILNNYTLGRKGGGKLDRG